MPSEQLYHLYLATPRRLPDGGRVVIKRLYVCRRPAAQQQASDSDVPFLRRQVNCGDPIIALALIKDSVVLDQNLSNCDIIKRGSCHQSSPFLLQADFKRVVKLEPFRVYRAASAY
jgi:hypothetical protein